MCYECLLSVNLDSARVTRFIQLTSGFHRPLDRVRLELLRSSGGLGRFFVRRREARVLFGGLFVVGVAFGLTVAAPFWLLALGPVIWGIPHVLSDLRYLGLRPGLHRRVELGLGVGLPIALAGAGWYPVQSGLVAAVMAGLLARGPGLRKLVVFALGAGLFWISVRVGGIAFLIFVHAHNLVALALWWSWRPASGGWRIWVPLSFLAAGAALWFGWIEPSAGVTSWAPRGMGGEYHLGQLAPELAEPWALRLVLLFAFAQAVHYGVWLRLIPEDDRAQPTPRTFGASFRALEKDFGSLLLWMSAVLMLGLAIWATMDLIGARSSYLRMALFHGFLELAAAALLFVEGHRGFEATRNVGP